MTESLLTGTDNAPTVDQNKDYFKELVGEDKKFKSPQDLARGKYESDLYIETLKRQQDELRADYLRIREDNMAKAKLQEYIDQLDSKLQQPSNSTIPNANEDNLEKPFDPKVLEGMVSQKLQEHEVNKKYQENYNTVRSKLIERYGDNYQALVKQQIDNLGLSEDFFNDLARRHPTVLFKTLGLDAEPVRDTFQTPPRSNQRSDSFGTTAKKRTWSYYQQLRRENPKVYYDPKTTVQMHNDYSELGSEFEDGDFQRI